MSKNIKRIYLDYAATTPVRPAVLRAMQPYFSGKFGNAGSLHSFGQEAIAAVDRSREDLARAIKAEFREIIFTGSATEANNMALRCAVRAVNQDPRIAKPRIIISSIEHESILETAWDLERDGVDVVYLPVDARGIVDLKKLKESLHENTMLVSVMYVNNEIGTVQPIAEMARLIQSFKKELTDSRLRGNDRGDKDIRKTDGDGNDRRGTTSPISDLRFPFFHCDASQAFQFFDCDTAALGVDLMTLSSHKIYGPKGAACLYVRGNTSPLSVLRSPITTGGGQEFGFRSGTENVPAIVGFAKAAEIVEANREKESKRIATLRDYFWRGIKKIFPKAEINGISGVASPLASPHILNIYFPGHDAQDILTRLDLAGIAASSGSACRSRAAASSYVIEALGFAKERARSSIRLSFGRPTTLREIDETLKIIRIILK